MTITLREFNEDDWHGWAGAEKFGTQNPLIYDADPKFVMTVGGSKEEGCPLIFVQILDPDDRDHEEYCYIPLRTESWNAAVRLAQQLATRLHESELLSWHLIRAMAEYC